MSTAASSSSETRYVESPLRMRELPDRRHLCQRVTDFFLSWYREAMYGLRTIALNIQERIYGAPPEYCHPETGHYHWKEGNRGLYLLIHGLNGRPNIWFDQLQLLRQQQPDCEIRIPYIHQRGNCKLSCAVEPIFQMLQSYMEENPGKPICIMGVSNGGRIAAELDLRLREQESKVRLSIVAGAIMGSQKMDLLKRTGLARFLHHKAIVREISYCSLQARLHLGKLQDPLPPRVQRSYEFFASTEDFQISPCSAALPEVGHGATYNLVHGENHSSIVSAICATQVLNCVDWMSAQKLKKTA